jgi:hypothetical protein
MNLKRLIHNLIVFTLALASHATAQEKKVAPVSPQLYNEIAHMDSILFGAFNTQNMTQFKPLFTQDLEWYQDNGGLLSYKTVFENFENNFKKESKLTRNLVKGSLEIHPIKDYGAIETGIHQFKHFENGQQETGTFKFMMIWRKENGEWKVSRVISYDH